MNFKILESTRYFNTNSSVDQAEMLLSNFLDKREWGFAIADDSK